MLENLSETTKNVLLFIAIGTVLIFIWFSEEPLPIDTDTLSQGEEPDAFMQKGVFREYDEQGNLSILFTSKQGIHFPDSEETIFGAPKVTIYQNNEASWEVDANRGQYYQDEKKLILQGSVRVQHPRESASVASLSSDQLTLFTETRFITTDQPVRIVDSNNEIAATGMNAWLNEKRIELQSRVKGTYHPIPGTNK